MADTTGRLHIEPRRRAAIEGLLKCCPIEVPGVADPPNGPKPI